MTFNPAAPTAWKISTETDPGDEIMKGLARENDFFREWEDSMRPGTWVMEDDRWVYRAGGWRTEAARTRVHEMDDDE